jgi:hypothetical protein
MMLLDERASRKTTGRRRAECLVLQSPPPAPVRRWRGARRLARPLRVAFLAMVARSRKL